MDRIGVVLEKVAFLPADRVTDDVSILTLKNWVFEPLCRWQDGSVAPGLFSAWTHSLDGRQWLFHIRDGACFHDGTPCVADHILDFIHGILGSVDMFGMRWSYARYFEGARFGSPSAREVSVAIPAPFADMPEVFSEFYVCRTDGQGQPILGTGPYRVCEFDANGHAVLVRVAGDGPERIDATAMPDPAARLDAVIAGRANLANRLDPDVRDDAADLAWNRVPSTQSVMAYLNCREGLFRQPEARRAINLAIDRDGLLDSLFGGAGVPAATIVSPFHFGFRAAGLDPIPYDPDAAGRLFDGCVITDEIVIRTPDRMPDKAHQIAAFVRDALCGLGLPTRIELQGDRPEYAREVGRGRIGDVALFDSTPHSTFRVLNDKISSTVRGVWWQGYRDAEIERLIRAANAAVDREALEAAYGRCLARLRDNPPWLYLFHPVETLAASPRATAVGLDHKGVVQFGRTDM